MVLKDVRPIIAELASAKKKIPLRIDVGRYLPEIRINVLGEGERCGLKKALRAIEQAPAIDAVEVVRCKDCDYNEPCPAPEGFVYCSRTGSVVKEDDYCSYGRRA